MFFYSKYSILDMKFILIYYKLEILTCWASDESLPESFTTTDELKNNKEHLFRYEYILDFTEVFG